MSLPQGINLRATLGFVTDGANEFFEDASAPYPRTTAQGNNVGWVSTTGVNTRDRNAGNDRRVAGTHFNTAAIMTYQIDLPTSGGKNIRCAAGDDSATGTDSVEVFDNTTSLGLIVNASPAAGSFVDALNTTYTAANWPGSNSPKALTFATTTLQFKMALTALNEAAHFYVEDQVSAPPVIMLEEDPQWIQSVRPA